MFGHYRHQNRVKRTIVGRDIPHAQALPSGSPGQVRRKVLRLRLTWVISCSPRSDRIVVTQALDIFHFETVPFCRAEGGAERDNQVLTTGAASKFATTEISE
jgi:hypothetical protein